MTSLTDISLENVTKVFRLGIIKKKTAVNNLSFTVPKGEVVGLLGPNGSGKSTTIKMMLGLLKPTSGKIEICGQDSSRTEARRYIGYLPENPKFQRFLTANQVLRYYGKLLNLSNKEIHKRGDHLLELVRLRHAANERTKGYSKGMVQRLAVAQALLSYPKILVFDEPMSGLDPLGRMDIRKSIWQIHEEMKDTTIFFSTHILGDVEELCSSVVLLKKGNLQKHCTIEELLHNDAQRFEVVLQNIPESMKESLPQHGEIRENSLGVTVGIEGVENLMSKLPGFQKSGAEIVGIFSRRQSLEQALFGDTEIGAKNAVELKEVS